MSRIDYYNDPDAPRANTLVPSASAIVTDQDGRILLHRRSDNQLWSTPGGTMEIVEAIRDTVIHEVNEETGLDVEPERLVGIYSNPNHVIAYPDGEVRQQFSIYFTCRLLGGDLTTSDETLDVGFFTQPRSSRCRSTLRSVSASLTSSKAEIVRSSPEGLAGIEGWGARRIESRRCGGKLLYNRFHTNLPQLAYRRPPARPSSGSMPG